MTAAIYCPYSLQSCTNGCINACRPIHGPNVVPLGQKRIDLLLLVTAIKKVVHDYDGRISVTEAIGALEIAKIEIYEGQK